MGPEGRRSESELVLGFLESLHDHAARELVGAYARRLAYEDLDEQFDELLKTRLAPEGEGPNAD